MMVIITTIYALSCNILFSKNYKNENKGNAETRADNIILLSKVSTIQSVKNYDTTGCYIALC